jgi:tRNA(fMet)-specific endonuclease VapC
MYLFDTDHLTILWYASGPEFDCLMENIQQHTGDPIYVSIVSFHEQIRGWLAKINRASGPSDVISGYQKLDQVLGNFARAQILGFCAVGSETFENLRSQRVRVGTLDLRIASIAIANNLTLLTRNVVDFERVPGLSIENWTR